MDEKKKIVKKGYDSCVDRYYKNRNAEEDRLKPFVDKLPEGGYVLDVGCGGGEPVTRYLAEKGYNVIGVDFSREMLKKASGNVPEADFVQQDINQMGFKEDQFDGLTAFYSIIHVPREEHRDVFGTFHQILKPNGVMLISLGSSEWEGKNDDFLGVEMFWSQHSPKKSLELVRKEGFKIIDDHVSTQYWEGEEERHLWVLGRNTK